ncbi:hypothetical protein [Burkholderia lata]|uniref:hypothetical protein n=1 Tax=Burkholderia lata (strain ATCC 17760 / DSM 23089 / LMG 22485 / NCIMB 9086 / R18194 / 383) TaxID=482957 RepID=UPI0015815528|nr:hypothetical protein [Burkholderia lata]
MSQNLAPSVCSIQRPDLLAVYGVWQTDGKMRHLIAHKLVDRTDLLGALPTSAREFC